MKLKTLFTALSLCALAGCASTESAQSEVEGKEANTQMADNDVVCESRASVGSHMKKRVCKTRAQMKKDEEEAARYMKSERRTVNGN
ncbi:hypothetical protein NI389_16845 [Pseudoalteromonas xiamenensis]|uniref:hypothetical protein n=1 Tax=Pseudoalteromonas xiamenensis TaxID=882626 RepID=UPI0027E3E3B4|nr:hypothetical protein [Pseudoalteromonas xiamenensis]WMN59810.1 hypothetical protein NI389_16845 [Pseudoalteromonas xiamenensis]